MTVVGLLHPGEMGAAVGAVLRDRGETVLWASAGRSAATAERARAAGLEDAGDVEELCRRCEILLSICPPHAALDVARAASGFTGIYVDANAIAPGDGSNDRGGCSRGSSTAASSGRRRVEPGTTRLYLSGGEAEQIAGLFAGTNLDARVISDRARRGLGAQGGVRRLDEGQRRPAAHGARARAGGGSRGRAARGVAALDPRARGAARRAERSARRKGWRWVGEMDEIARSMAAQDLPAGFHEAAAEVFRRAAEES